MYSFFDDTSILFVLDEENMKHLMQRLDIICNASGTKISISKFILLEWDEHSLAWCYKFNIGWGA